ncbi:hypothetical protein [Paractinoplanes durhamensis]|uniref:hypothetical protein n=1 Tax=Paractinoplanes durhamensis TaxID=113563 RepID=UPI0036349193
MQPQEPVTGPVPQPPQARGPLPVPGGPRGAAGGGGGLGKPRSRRGRLILAMAAGVIGLLCLGGVGVFVSLYDEATEIKRSEPDAVVDNFLRAYLVNRDDQRASLYQCKSGGDFAQILDYRNDIVSRERQYSVGIRVTWSTFTVNTNGKTGVVTTDLIKTASDQSGRLSNSWQFNVVDDDGWRVCGGSPLS